ncbi:MAG TPA: DUF222 domain-containing protein, partial [Nocardioides sp.]|nr:DUF222 domain-containing protein [Nocardioides sp.]
MTALLDAPTAPAAAVASARETVAALADTLWAAARPEDLLAVTEELQALRSTLAAVEARVAVEVEATEAAKTAGWVSPADYLTHVAGGRHGHGSRTLRTARGLCGDRSGTLLALQAGDLSPEHAEVIVTVIDRLPVSPSLRDEAERVLIGHAATLNATELRKAGEHLLEVLDPDGTARTDERALDRLERSAHLGRFLTIAEDGIGGVRLRGRGTVEDATLIKTALFALAAPQPGPDPDTGQGDRDLRDHGARCWDALVELSLRAQETDGLLPDQHGAKPRLTITVGLDSLRAGTGAATLETGDTISVAALRRLACDAAIVPAVLGNHGEVLDVGRTQRLVTAGIWKALTLRDRHCRFPGCRRMPLACDAHHLQHWADGGATSLDNLVLL